MDPVAHLAMNNIMLGVYLIRRRRQRRRRKHRMWVRNLFLTRPVEGAFQTTVNHLRLDPVVFQNYHRLTVEQFDWLLERVHPALEGINLTRIALESGLKLSLTLRYLASGDSMASMSYQYRIGRTSVSRVIRRTCLAIWEALHEEFLPFPDMDRFLEIAEGFEERWNFPNCAGAIDGKHILAKAFDNTGTRFFNYHRTFSTVLLACCDDQYKFSFVHIGACGRESDAGIFQNTNFGQSIIQETIQLPPPIVVESAPGVHKNLLAVFVGDAAFPLCPNLLKSYGGNNLTPEQRIFNYRLSRARRVIENSFGILAARFQIFRKKLFSVPYEPLMRLLPRLWCSTTCSGPTKEPFPVA